jgi:hypothetical protein
MSEIMSKSKIDDDQNKPEEPAFLDGIDTDAPIPTGILRTIVARELFCLMPGEGLAEASVREWTSPVPTS